jgi:hypothetical protein
VQRSPPQVAFEEELNLSLFQTYKVSLDRLEDNIFTLSRLGLSLFELEEIPYWRYETIIEKTNQWFESLKNAKQKRMNGNEETSTIFDMNVNKNPSLWTTN